MDSQVSRVKRTRMLSNNQIREIVMDWDSEGNYYESEDMDDEAVSPTLTTNSISQPPSPDFSDSISLDAGNVAGKQPQPSVDTTPKPRRRVVRTVMISVNCDVVLKITRHFSQQRPNKDTEN